MTKDLTERLGAHATIVPMTDDDVRTVIRTSDGDLAFQEHFVRRRAEPVAREILYRGAESAEAKSASIES